MSFRLHENRVPSNVMEAIYENVQGKTIAIFNTSAIYAYVPNDLTQSSITYTFGIWNGSSSAPFHYISQRLIVPTQLVVGINEQLYDAWTNNATGNTDAELWITVQSATEQTQNIVLKYSNFTEQTNNPNIPGGHQYYYVVDNPGLILQPSVFYWMGYTWVNSNSEAATPSTTNPVPDPDGVTYSIDGSIKVTIQA